MTKSYHAFHDPENQVRIEDVAFDLLREGLSDDDALKEVRIRFPNAQTSLNSIRCYRSILFGVRRAAPATTRRLLGAKHGPATRRALEAIAAYFADEEVLEYVRSYHPDSRTTLASIASFRSQMRKKDPSIPTSREAKIRQGLLRSGRVDGGRER